MSRGLQVVCLANEERTMSEESVKIADRRNT